MPVADNGLTERVTPEIDAKFIRIGPLSGANRGWYTAASE